MSFLSAFPQNSGSLKFGSISKENAFYGILSFFLTGLWLFIISVNTNSLPASPISLWIAELILSAIIFTALTVCMIRLFKNAPVIFLLVLISCGYLIRLTLMFSVDLVTDEAHYGLYGLLPALSYFDHPPMVGYLNALMLKLGNSDILLRIIPELLHGLTIYLLFKICRYISNDFSTFVWTVIFYELSPVINLLGIGLVPESVLIPLILILVLSILRLHQSENCFYWVWIGMLYGLMGMTKYTAVLFIPAVVPAIISKPTLLKTFYLPLGMMAGIVFILPVLIWNAQNDWVSFAYQLKRSFGGNSNFWILPGMILVYGLVYGLVIIETLFSRGFKLIKSYRKFSLTEKILLFSALPLFVVTWYSTHKGVTLPHWIAISTVSVMPICAKRISFIPRMGVYKVFVILSVFICAMLWVIASYLVLANDYPWRINNKHPKGDIMFWKQAAAEVSETAKGKPVFLPNWSHMSRFAWYAYPKTVYTFSENITQFTLIYGFPNAGTNGLLVLPTRGVEPTESGRKKYTEKFNRCEFIKDVRYPSAFNNLVFFKIYDCYGYKP